MSLLYNNENLTTAIH